MVLFLILYRQFILYCLFLRGTPAIFTIPTPLLFRGILEQRQRKQGSYLFTVNCSILLLGGFQQSLAGDDCGRQSKGGPGMSTDISRAMVPARQTDLFSNSQKCFATGGSALPRQVPMRADQSKSQHSQIHRKMVKIERHSALREHTVQQGKGQINIVYIIIQYDIISHGVLSYKKNAWRMCTECMKIFLGRLKTKS